MENKLLLFPHRFRKIGWIILIPAAVVGIMMWADGFDGVPSFLLPEAINSAAGTTCHELCHGETTARILNNAVLIGILAGTAMICCSREKVEDEMSGIVRLNSLLMAFYANTAAICVTALFVYDLEFLEVMIWELISLPVLFLAIYRARMYALKKRLGQ